MSLFDQFESLILPLIKESPKQKAILTFDLFVTRGNLDIGIGVDGQLVYITMSRDQLKRFLTSGRCAVVLRVGHNKLPGRKFPLKKLYAFALGDGKIIRLSKEDNLECSLTDNFTGERLDPEPDVEYC